MKQIQCNALNIKTTIKQVWLYFIRSSTQHRTQTLPQIFRLF